MTTVRAVFDEVRNALDYLVDAQLALYAAPVSMTDTRVSWHPAGSGGPFLEKFEHPTISQYTAWLEAGHYSAILFDASLVQISYEVEAGSVVGHRLGYFPCPYDADVTLLSAGEAVGDVLDLYRDSDPVLRSPVRFDFDPGASRPGHPSSHFTFNSTTCRVACVAPVHTLRFLDFVFEAFYPELHAAHRPFFEPARWTHVTAPELRDLDIRATHIAWDTRATASGGSIGR